MSDIWEKAKILRIVPAAIFFYDCFRLLFLFAMLVFFQMLYPEFRINNFPLIMYTSPNALFPMMAFFLLIRYKDSRPFIPLYITGKILCVLCMMIWLVFTLNARRDFIFMEQFKKILWVLFLITADLAAIMGMILQIEETPQISTVIEAAQPAVGAAEGGE